MREPEFRYAAIQRAVWRISSPSRAVWRAYQATTRPSIPQPLYGLLGAFAISVLPSPDARRQFGNCKRVAPSRLRDVRERQTACSAAATGDCVRRDRTGRARPQKNRAPVPGVPGLQQSQFATPGDTETASHCHAKGGPSLNKSGQVKSRQIPTSGAKRAPEAKPGQM